MIYLAFWKKEQKLETNLSEDDWPNHVEILNEENFNDFIEKFPMCFIDFWAPWCAPCKKMKPRMRRLSKIFEGKVAFGEVDIQKNKSLAKKYKIMSVPSFILFKNEKKKAFFTALKSTGEIKKIIKKNL